MIVGRIQNWKISALRVNVSNSTFRKELWGRLKHSLKLSFYDLQGIKLNLAVCKKQVD